MFILSSNSRPNDIVPLSATLRFEQRRKLQTERDDYLQAQAQAFNEKKFGMAACYHQMALAVNDRMQGCPVDPFVLDLLVDGKERCVNRGSFCEFEFRIHSNSSLHNLFSM